MKRILMALLLCVLGGILASILYSEWQAAQRYADFCKAHPKECANIKAPDYTVFMF